MVVVRITSELHLTHKPSIWIEPSAMKQISSICAGRWQCWQLKCEGWYFIYPPCDMSSTMSAAMPKAQMKLCMVRSSHLDIGTSVLNWKRTRRDKRLILCRVESGTGEDVQYLTEPE